MHTVELQIRIVSARPSTGIPWGIQDQVQMPSWSRFMIAKGDIAYVQTGEPSSLARSHGRSSVQYGVQIYTTTSYIVPAKPKTKKLMQTETFCSWSHDRHRIRAGQTKLQRNLKKHVSDQHISDKSNRRRPYRPRPRTTTTLYTCCRACPFTT